MIKQFNKILEETLSKLEKIYDQDKFIKSTLIFYNISQQVNIQIIPYYLIFERNLKLPIKKNKLTNITILDRIIILIYKIFLFQKNVKIVINRT